MNDPRRVGGGQGVGHVRGDEHARGERQWSTPLTLRDVFALEPAAQTG